MRTHYLACQQGVQLGESYIFTCPGNLNHIVYPLVSKSVLLGGVLVGPFLMDSPDSTLFSEMAQSFGLSHTVLLELYDRARFVPVILPSQVQHISRLLTFLLRHCGGRPGTAGGKPA